MAEYLPTRLKSSRSQRSARRRRKQHGGARIGWTAAQAIQFNPSYVEAYDNRAFSHEALGRHAEAIADFRKAQSIDPADLVSKQQLRVLGF